MQTAGQGRGRARARDEPVRALTDVSGYVLLPTLIWPPPSVPHLGRVPETETKMATYDVNHRPEPPRLFDGKPYGAGDACCGSNATLPVNAHPDHPLLPTAVH